MLTYDDWKAHDLADDDTGVEPEREEEGEPMPQAECPKCGQWVTDWDGFGVLEHVGPSYANPCGYCSHPSIDDGVCGICGVRP
jgi:hypothetical protein